MTTPDSNFLERIPKEASTVGGDSTEVNVSSSIKTTENNYTAASSSTANVAFCNSKTILTPEEVESLLSELI